MIAVPVFLVIGRRRRLHRAQLVNAVLKTAEGCNVSKAGYRRRYLDRGVAEEAARDRCRRCWASELG